MWGKGWGWVSWVKGATSLARDEGLLAKAATCSEHACGWCASVSPLALPAMSHTTSGSAGLG